MIRIIVCPHCWGEGEVCVGLNDDFSPILEDCPKCLGSGWTREKDDEKRNLLDMPRLWQ